MTHPCKRLGFASVLVVSLTACGGGGSDAVDTSPTPSAAGDTSTLDRFLAYQRTATPPETIDPTTLQKQLAPIDDTAEPTRLN
jgi:hypothetical protein